MPCGPRAPAHEVWSPPLSRADRAAGGQAGLAAEFEEGTSLRIAQRPMAAAAPTVAHGVSSQGCQPRPRALPSSQNTRVCTAKKAPMRPTRGRRRCRPAKRERHSPRPPGEVARPPRAWWQAPIGAGGLPIGGLTVGSAHVWSWGNEKRPRCCGACWHTGRRYSGWLRL